MTLWNLPQAQFLSFNTAELADPGITRHLPSGSPAYIKNVTVGCTGALVFEDLKLEPPATVASSKVAAVNLSFPNFADLISSGLQAIYNMRVFIPTGSGNVLDLPGISLQYIPSGIWRPNLDFPSGLGQTFVGTLPSQFNLKRIDGRPELFGYSALNCSEYLYMRLFVDETFPIGLFGICGSGLLRIRCVYDFF